MAAGQLFVKVVSPETTVFSGDARGIVAPAWDGKVGILPGHASLITLLGAGVLSIEEAGGAQEYHVAGGLLKVEANQVTVLTEYASDEPAPAALVRDLIGANAPDEASPRALPESAGASA